MNILASVGAVAAAGFAYSAGYEVRAFTTRFVQVPVLPAGSAPIRILHTSDLHLTPHQGRKQAWLRSLGESDADVVIATGDFWANPHALAPLLQALEPHLKKPGAFVFGSNDYYAPLFKNPARYLGSDDGLRIHGAPMPFEELRTNLTASGWLDLNDDTASIEVRGQRLALRGTDDPHLDLDRYEEIAGPWEAGVPIGVTHAPYLRVLDAMESDGARLILAGHTHGGQLRLPGFGALVTNCDLDRGRARGLSRHRDAWLHVSAGCGTNPYTPVRFACRPEATLLTLVAGV